MPGSEEEEPLAGRHASNEKPTWQRGKSRVTRKVKRYVFGIALLILTSISIYIRSVYFFKFPTSWYYKHGCSSYSDARPSASDLGETADTNVHKLKNDVNNILGERCVPLSFGKMADRVSTLLDVTLSLGDQPREEGNGRILGDLQTRLTQHLLPFLTQTLGEQRTLDDLRASYTEDRAIIIPVGIKGFRMASHNIAIIRNVHKSTLPIQIMYAGDDDLPLQQRQALRSIGPDIELVNIEHYFNGDIVDLPHGKWAIKPFAMVASKYKQVLLADADAVFLQSPDVLFSDPEYAKTGTWFFHDEDWTPHPVTRHWARGHAWLQHVLNERKNTEPSPRMRDSRWTKGTIENEGESGVVLLNKEHPSVLTVLLFVCWMNTAKVREVTYHYTWGDKESFWLAFELLHVPYHFEATYAAAIGDIEDGKLRGHPLHLDAQGKPLWHNGGMWKLKAKKEQGWIDPEAWIENKYGWEPDLQMHRWDEGDVHQIKDTKLGALEQEMIQAAEGVDRKNGFGS